MFADLNLGASDKEEDESPGKDGSRLSQASVAPYISMLAHEANPNAVANHQLPLHEGLLKEAKRSKKKKKSKHKPNSWANKCMYAELLEMVADNPWNDGLPSDLESKWVAVGPVPVGKRCLAVTHQSSGITGNAPNTTLRSRLLGKVLIQRFPSVLPPLTILDCILDANWRENGILHVLDVVKWKGQDVGDCETSFRFWWRDTRLAELNQSSTPVISSSVPSVSQNDEQPQYVFPYPTTLLPVPYHTDTTFSSLSTQIIPFARSARSIIIDIPTPYSGSMSLDAVMDIDLSTQVRPSKPPTTLIPVSKTVAPDGLLLYMAEASYEAGISPLSSWIPIAGHREGHDPLKGSLSTPPSEGPLDLFQRLVQRRLMQGSSHGATPELEMEL